MKIVAANYAESLQRRPWNEMQEMHVVDCVTDELRAHFGDAADDVPADILALAMRLEPMVAERVYTA